MDAGPIYYVWEKAIPPAVCDAIIAEWDDDYVDSGTIELDDGIYKLAAEYREVEMVRLHPNHWTAALPQHFGRGANDEAWGLEVIGAYSTVLIKYTEGSHYRWHRDSPDIDDPNEEPDPNNRNLSIVAMLSDPSQFEGGELKFRDLAGEEIIDERVQAQGSVTVFRSNVLHSVERVRAGERYTLVSWLVGGSAAAQR